MFKPLLAAPADLSTLAFPVLASPKIDGIRCLITEEGAVSRTLKPIPNRHIRAMLSDLPVGYDGELLTFTNGERDDFNTVQSKVMRADGEPEFTFQVFDNFALDATFEARLRSLATTNFAIPVHHQHLSSMAELDAFERECVEDHGWEGIMLRAPRGPYKFGRSTVKERILLKVKRFEDDEAVVISCIEQMENQNLATRNALGRTERSTCKDGLVPKGTLGALSCSWRGITFEIGTGFNDAQRADLWSRRGSMAGTRVTFKFQGVGPNGKPRFPSFKAIRIAE